MNQFFQQIYTLWCAIVFAVVFLVLLPFFGIIIPFKKLHVYSFYLNKIWAHTALFLVGIEPVIQYEAELDKNVQYVYCANHFSLLDILSFGFAPHCVLFVGKASLAKIPLFGWMFKEIHVTVDRASNRNSYRALQLAMEKMGEDKSLVMFPEGGVYTKEPPQMVRFKDGAFRAAIEKQIAIVPVTLPDNWIILPDQKYPLIRRRPMRMVFHSPIKTEGLKIDDIGSLKKEVANTIQLSLNSYNSISYEYQ